ncbi:hypothetical protein CWI38_0012p0030 [Hamiltosporidium tvaerminnensis]|uniref:Uncharacterized protein n=1 Tax=Hamiltosporidium tvaerminnensis TaxID=1176355 RepID=A0A4Q9M3V8_9MICR|nr:hypothetical protein CWI38_0012p0030 [Hamiltosporidium tvaerminnensis]
MKEFYVLSQKLILSKIENRNISRILNLERIMLTTPYMYNNICNDSYDNYTSE